MKKILIMFVFLILSGIILGQNKYKYPVHANGGLRVGGDTKVLIDSVSNINGLKFYNGSSILNFKDKGIFNVLDYGAKADATWADGSGTCDSSAFQDAIDAAVAAGGGSVYVPTGNYLILEEDGPILIGPGVKILCGNNVNLYVPKTFAGTVFRIASTSTSVQESGISGGRIRMQEDGSVHTYIGVELRSTSNSYYIQRCKINDVIVEFAGVAFNLVTENNGWINWNTFDNIYSHGCVSAFKTRESGGSLGIDYNSVRTLKVQVTAITTIGLDSISGSGNTFTDYQTVDWDASPTGRSGVLTSTSRGNYVQLTSDDGSGFIDNGIENTIFVFTSHVNPLPGTGYHLVMTHNRDPLDDVSYGLNYPLVLRSITDNNGDGTGIAFINGTSSQSYNVGGSIIFNKTDTYSKGKLQFYTKRSNSTGVAPVLAMTLGDDGNTTTNGLRVGGNAKVLIDSISNIEGLKFYNGTTILNPKEKGIFNALDYGLISGDGLEDGTAIRAAITAAEAYSGTYFGNGEVIVPAGEYNLSDSIELKSNVHLTMSRTAIFTISDSWHGSIFHSSGAAIKYAGVTGGVFYSDHYQFTGIKLVETVSENGSHITFSNFRDIIFYGGKTGIYFETNNSGFINANEFSNIIIQDCVNGLEAIDGGSSGGMDGNLFHKITIQASANTDYGLKDWAGSNNTFIDLWVWDLPVGGTGVALEGAHNTFTGGYIPHVSFVDNSEHGNNIRTSNDWLVRSVSGIEIKHHSIAYAGSTTAEFLLPSDADEDAYNMHIDSLPRNSRIISIDIVCRIPADYPGSCEMMWLVGTASGGNQIIESVSCNSYNEAINIVDPHKPAAIATNYIDPIQIWVQADIVTTLWNALDQGYWDIFISYIRYPFED